MCSFSFDASTMVAVIFFCLVSCPCNSQSTKIEKIFRNDKVSQKSFTLSTNYVIFLLLDFADKQHREVASIGLQRMDRVMGAIGPKSKYQNCNYGERSRGQP